MLASGCVNGHVRVFDLKNRRVKSTYSTHIGGITSLSLHPNDYILASSSQMGDIQLHNL